ncbi:MAG: hypothetical protein EOO10_20360 [Chitinophagaceae bacterium]|nr:MAG: hypothetical protein EOO10_20360 [Chitinophagaceae bacterium]
MKVFLTSAYGDVRAKEWLLAHDPMAATLHTTNPADADVIIFAENHPGHDPYFRAVLKNDIYRKYKEKCVLYHDADRSITPLPTLSPSIETWQFNARHKRTAHYIARLCENDAVNNAAIQFQAEREYLYNFIGARTHKIRAQLLSLDHPADAYIKDTTGSRAWELDPEQKVAYELAYSRVMQESFFVLCPRGVGPCTYRLFETMQLGRVPVIVSDEWPKVPNVDWDQFSISVKESAIQQIPAILRERKGEAAEMGKMARVKWEEHFSPQVSLRHLSQAAYELVAYKYTMADTIKDYAQFLQDKWHFRNLLRYKVKKHLRK